MEIVIAMVLLFGGLCFIGLNKHFLETGKKELMMLKKMIPALPIAEEIEDESVAQIYRHGGLTIVSLAILIIALKVTVLL